MNGSPSNEWPRGVRLDSWKAIAQHLGRNPRTAQRWHRTLGLPVHHLRGDSGTVFAFSDELDEWFQGSRTSRQRETPDLPAPLQMPSQRSVDGEGGLDGLSVAGESQEKARSRALVNEAYQVWNLLTGCNLRIVARSFREALDLDPGNAEAYAGLAHALIAQGLFGNLSLPTTYASAQTAAEKALQIDPGSSEATCAKAWLDVVWCRDWQGAGARLEQLMEQPTTRAIVGRALLHIAEGNCRTAAEFLASETRQNSLSSLSLGLSVWSDYLMGAYDEVLDYIVEARESGHRGAMFGAVEALTCIQSMTPEQAIRRIKILIDEEPENVVARGALAYLWGATGSEANAHAALQHLTNHHSHIGAVEHYALALAYLGLDEKSQAIRSIVSSYESGSIWSLAFPVDPALQVIAGDADFGSFVKNAYPASLDAPIQTI